MRKTVWLILPVLFLIAGGSRTYGMQNKCNVSIESFGHIIVLESGRKKPMETFARNKLMQFSGRQKLKSGLSALQWLSRVLFDPSSADNDLIFLIDNPEVADALGITARAKRRYCFSELYSAGERLEMLAESAMKKKPEEWSFFEKEIIKTRSNLHEYLLLRSTFSFSDKTQYLNVNDSALNARLNISNPPSMLELLSRADVISASMKSIQAKGFDSLNSEENALIELVNRMMEMGKQMGNPAPHLIPVMADEEQWMSPWGVVNRFKSGSANMKPFIIMKNIKESYLESNQDAFDKGIIELAEYVKETANGKVKLKDPALEIFYNKLKPFLFAKIIYGLAVLLALMALAGLWKKAYPVSMSLVFVGIILHTSGIVLRMVIMARPPVTNLYETFTFTAWAAVFLGIVLEWIKIRNIGVLTASATGFIFLHIAGKYALDGDTMGMLSAVLDSSFWLTTHIVTISLGYAGFVAAGLIGHVYLVYEMSGKNNKEYIQSMSKSIYGIFVFGFIFTIIGTIFGGMWADQAWGRFWGWDPKENGALLMILWGLIVLHCRLDGLMKNTGTAVGSIIGVVLVMCAWIGVNLLGIGLHSYGFTSAGARALLIYLSFEAAFLLLFTLIFFSRKKDNLQEQAGIKKS